jgi:SAM-dependent methyltransferase
MLLEEAKWLNRQLRNLPSADLYPMCNLGSSTEHYRKVQQAYIDKYLFAPARMKNLEVIHVDAKDAPGVDFVADLTDSTLVARLAKYDVRSVMCCNLLEHVSDRTILSEVVLSILKPGGYLIATVPYKFPYHADPIDTMYRPTVAEVAGLFPGTSVHSAAIVRASRFAYEMQGNYRDLLRLVARSAVPFYRPRRWWANVRRLNEIMAGYKVTCVILRKQGGGVSKVNFSSI